MVAANNVLDWEGTEFNKELVLLLNRRTRKASDGASLPWVVGGGPDSRLELSLQCLPATTSYLAGNPTLQG